MITITINNSYSQIEGLKTDEFRALRKVLSYTSDPKAAYFSRGFAFRKYLIDKKGFFPTGLLHIVYSQLKGHIETIDNRIRPLNRAAIEFSSLTPYRAQDRAVESALQALRGGIIMPTGTGKSLVIAMIAAQLGVKTLVIVPTLEIKKQLSADMGKYGLFNISIMNIDNPKLKNMTDFDCLIIDECHHAAAKTYQNLNKTAWRGIYYRFFMTATFFRNQQNEQLLFEGIAGKPIFQLTQKEAIKEGYIVPIEAYYVDLPKQPTEAYTWREVYSELVVHNDFRNSVIVGHLEALKLRDKFTLCLVKEIAHGKILSEATGVPFVSGQDEESRQYIELFKRGEIKQLIGTTGVLGEGIDTKPAEYIIIAALGKAKSAFMQQIGRGVRKYLGKTSAKVILFRDTNHKFLLRHFKEQVKILLEEYGVKVQKLGD